MGHKVKENEAYISSMMAEYIEKNSDGINIVARE